jgi:hypothetical protein
MSYYTTKSATSIFLCMVTNLRLDVIVEAKTTKFTQLPNAATKRILSSINIAASWIGNANLSANKLFPKFLSLISSM